MRPNAKYQEASANECRAVPMEVRTTSTEVQHHHSFHSFSLQCLVAANGGEPVGPPQVMTVQPPLITMPMVINKPRKEHGGGGFIGGNNGELVLFFSQYSNHSSPAVFTEITRGFMKNAARK